MSQSTSNTDCFENLIGLRGLCEEGVSSSGLWINDTGIDEHFLSAVVTKDYKDPLDLFLKKREFAIQTASNQVHAFMRPKYKSTTVIEDLRTGYFKDDLVQVVGNGKLKGIQFDVCNSGSYLDFHISEIALQINATQTVAVLVYDLIQNKLLDTFDIDCTADEVSKIYINKTYSSPKRKLNLFIGYDSTGISANTTTLTDGCKNCSGGNTQRVLNSYETIRSGSIALTDNKINGNVKSESDTGGLSIVHSLSCNHENWLCAINNSIAFPILYKTAYLIYEHAATASRDQRINTTVTINAEQVKERAERMDFLYSQAMNDLIQNIRPPKDNTCFHCRDNVRSIIALP